LPEEKTIGSRKLKRKRSRRKHLNPPLGALRPQTLHRSPRQAFGGTTTTNFLKTPPQRKKILVPNPLDKIPIAEALVPSACGF
jgi:hypothetical protein